MSSETLLLDPWMTTPEGFIVNELNLFCEDAALKHLTSTNGGNGAAGVGGLAVCRK